jgi:selenium metabolism protein YedF
MACPAPVVTTKKALEESGAEGLELLVDAGAARENVTRFLQNRGYRVDEAELEQGFALRINRAEAVPAKTQTAVKSGETVILLTSDRLGDGPEELGKLLMKNFIITLLELPDLPSRMIFLNTAVHLTTEGSEVVEPLQKLANMGVEILSCGLCLDFFHKKEKLKAGTVTNMYNSAEALMAAGSVIKL